MHVCVCLSVTDITPPNCNAYSRNEAVTFTITYSGNKAPTCILLHWPTRLYIYKELRSLQLLRVWLTLAALAHSHGRDEAGRECDILVITYTKWLRARAAHNMGNRWQCCNVHKKTSIHRSFPPFLRPCLPADLPACRPADRLTDRPTY